MHYKPFYQKHSLAIRLWHWLTFFAVLLLFYSVFVGKFFLNPYNNVPIIHDILQQSGKASDPDPSYPIAAALSKKIWDWHVRYGYALAGLFVFRVLLEFFRNRSERFFYSFVQARRAAGTMENRKPARHYMAVRVLYMFFYGLLATIVGTGIWLSFHRQPEEMAKAHTIKEIHGACFYILFLFVAIHITGVVLAERKRYKNIISGMVNGGQEARE